MPGKRKRGWTAPGYNYMGPGNPMDNGPPVDADDWASWHHDKKYKRYEDEQGIDAKKVWVPEDQQWLDETDWYGWSGFGKAWFTGKKWAAAAGLIDSATLKPQKPKRPSLRQGIEPQRKNPYLRGLPGRNIFAEDNKAQTQLNSQENAQPVASSMDTGLGIGSGNNAGLKETPVDNVGKRVVERGPPEYTFASLPYVKDLKRSYKGWGDDMGFRMTSPIDPVIAGDTTVDINTDSSGLARFYPLVTTDATDTVQTAARWWDFYSSMYNYYHVLGAKWHLTVENLCNEPFYLHQFYCNDEYPPKEATNEDIMSWKDARSYYIGTHAVSLKSDGILENNQSNTNVTNVEGAATAGQTANYEDGNNVQSRAQGPLLKLSGSYKPGQFRRQIHLDSEIENWTSVNANPSLPERLVFRTRPYWNAVDTNNTSDYERTLSFRYTFRIDYLVEFKELKVGLRWPIERQPLLAVISNNAEEDEEP